MTVARLSHTFSHIDPPKINQVPTYLVLLSSLNVERCYRHPPMEKFNRRYETRIRSREELSLHRPQLLSRELFRPTLARSGIECLADGLHVGTIFRRSCAINPLLATPRRRGRSATSRRGSSGARPVYFLRYVPAARRHRPELSRERPNSFRPCSVFP